MKKLALPLAGLLLVVPALGAHAGRSRTATGEYNTILITPNEGSPGASGQISNGVVFKTRQGEYHVSVALADDSGMAVPGLVEIDHNGDLQPDDSLEFCGETSKPLATHPGAKVYVSAQEGECGDSIGVSTFGTVTATFTR